MITYDKIEEQVKIVNDKKISASTDQDWQEFNTQWNKLGDMIESYGRLAYNREKEINIILSTNN